MLSAAIFTLIAFIGVVAVLTGAHCILQARAVYGQLMREGEILRAGLVLQGSVAAMPLRPTAALAPRRAVATRREMPQLARPLCAAA